MLDEKVSKDLLALDEEPKLEANRIGHGSAKNPRPVKVSVSDSSIVLQIFRIVINTNWFLLARIVHQSNVWNMVNLLSSTNRNGKWKKTSDTLLKWVDYTLLISNKCMLYDYDYFMICIPVLR